MVTLFDMQSGFDGAPRAGERVTAGALLATMDRLSIAGALVRTAPDDVEVDVLAANDALYAACAVEPRLVPCPVVLPATAGDVPPEEEQVAAAIASGARAAVVRPGLDRWEILDWVSGRLFAALEERHLPLLCLIGHLALRDVAAVAERHPALPLVLAQVPYGCQRVLYPLLERHREVRLSLGENVTVHTGIEEMVRRFGASRLLFGTGFPRVEPMMAVTQLAYADIPEADRLAIGSGNARALLGAVRRGGAA